jgi:hypothetical protein
MLVGENDAETKALKVRDTLRRRPFDLHFARRLRLRPELGIFLTERTAQECRRWGCGQRRLYSIGMTKAASRTMMGLGG